MKLKNVLRIVFVLVGLTIAIFIAKKVGFESIVDNFKTLSWRAIPILGLSAIWYLLYTYAWNMFLKQLPGEISLWDLYRAKVSGETVNTLTPASFLGGDPVRIYILKNHFPVAEGAASVVVDRTLHTFAVLFTIFLGMFTAFWRLPFLPLNMRYGLPIVLLICFVFMALVFTHQRRGFFSFLMNILKKLRIKKHFSKKTIKKFEELDINIANFHIKYPVQFWGAFALHLTGRLLGILEIYIVGKIFLPEFTLFAALLLGALAPLMNFLFAFIPGALGVMEGAFSGVLYLLNMPPEVGISIQVFRRARATFWILIGFIFIATHKKRSILENKIRKEI